MGRLIADISMSLDGFVTGPDPNEEHGLGIGGEALHTWAISSEDELDAQILREGTAATGAVVMGRTLFDYIDGPNGWSDEMGYGAREAGRPAFFVVTHRAPASVRLAEHGFEFVTDGLETALERARAAAGDKLAVIMGGGSVIGQAVAAGLVDELRIHLAPVLLGSGTPLFTGGQHGPLEQVEVQVSSTATHLTYAIR